ncbi:hypothetical protein I3843_07G210500 [Carya illinoinensis]|uniref:Lunapark zinc ribbon domain-containing protein n=1 Tax=Carya illinoinensis TaxID=32201 RepID=A0A8T1PYW3_CARIL|nr:uncharacterized protein At2g24330 [Carya illinoinensis]XP_042988222.1 uncharacterized protein At2g24330 [Carya illinoinensis]XP_042988223.1 uncharacterized protein At2g24330 [Carya illinoinensis]KAG6649475.1 hypothetical protein CIPAW_07G214900 [Carya illinoinensis]KAG6649476.1 hypothetical protein CIPAW_07G214900 [Carya illinoinensis]KAG7973040.1 hypothetical protein I3843_07G210500 [Carya illinoinensis]KAG7973041.1 hypothetical protein I3843_07G210500 [Carya illinoinensis]KAG7973042.1 h
MAEDKGIGEGEKEPTAGGATTTTTTTDGNEKKKQRGFLSRVWKGIFRLHGDDFEKRLQYISKEEAAVLARMKRRSQSWRRMTRNLIIFSVIFEVIAVGYAIMTTRSVDLNWKMRALRVLPMFLLPGLSSAIYSTFVSFTRMCDRKDQKTLERLRAERQAKIDELKERTNYYSTQQLIQRYDSDPAAKAAAATVLASKLGADSGLKLYVGDESKLNAPTGKSNDVELAQSGGLRNRKQVQTRSGSAGSTPKHHSDEETPRSEGTEGPQTSEHNQLVVSHHSTQGSVTNDGGWIARIAALLVGEDPTQSYALICGNCHMHNGLARKEDFSYITYYCPHCNALNRPKLSVEEQERISGSNTPNLGSLRTGGSDDAINNASASGSDSGLTTNSHVRAVSEIEEVTERVTSEQLAS